MRLKRKGWLRYTKNFLLHKLSKIRKRKCLKFRPYVQLDLIEGKISYDKGVVQSETFRDFEIDYLNEFHKENNQPLIWIEESLYKVEMRKRILDKN